MQHLEKRYTTQEQIGAGAMGSVYRVMDRLTGQVVALKRVMTTYDSLIFTDTTAPNSSGAQRAALVNEFQLLASLRHPNIISVYDFGFDAKTQPYFTMEYLPDAYTILDGLLGHSMEAKVMALLDLLEALRYLHRREVLHRDLKPSNVLFSQGTVRLLDFGLSVSRDTAYGHEGTMTYIAPEVILYEVAEERSDLYAVGLIAYQLFAGRYPYRYETLSELVQCIIAEEPDYTDMDAPAAVRNVIQRLLQKEPKARYASAGAVIAALRDAMRMPPREDTSQIRESFLRAASFTGRLGELQRLQMGLRQLQAERKSALWLVGGTSGVGKSRLLQELQTRALVEGVRVLHGQAIAESGMPFIAWQQPLRHLLLDSDLPAEQASLLQTIVPDVARLLEKDIPANTLTGAAWSTQFSQLLMTLLRQADQPILIILEDLQWADVSLLEPLINSDLPLMIVGSYRIEEAPTLPIQLPSAQVITLQRFDRAQIQALSRAMLGALHPAIIDLLERETAGNPYFMVETMRALAQQVGGLDAIGEAQLPDSVQASGVQMVLQHRLAALADEDLHLLQLAAVAGRQLDVGLLQGIAGKADLSEWLVMCTNQMILEPQGTEYRFVHDLMREHIIQQLPADTRQAHHLALAKGIEALYPQQLADYAALLVLHWGGAGVEEKEAYFARLAGERAFAQDNLMDALRYYERALALRVYEQDENPQQSHAELLHQIGRAHQNLGNYPESRTKQAEALHIYQRLGDEFGIANTTYSIGEADMRMGNNAAALEHTEKALQVFTRQNDVLRVGYCYLNLGIISANQGDYPQAEAYTVQARQHLEQTNNPREVSKALNNLGILYDIAGKTEQAEQALQQVLTIRRQLDDQLGLGSVLINLAHLYRKQGDRSLALDYTLEAESLGRQTGALDVVSTACGLLGQLYTEIGDYERALPYYNTALDIARAKNMTQVIAVQLQHIGDWHQHAHDDDRTAWDYFVQALQMAHGVGAQSVVLGTFNHMGKVLAKYQQPDLALTVYAHVHHYLDSHPDEIMNPVAQIDDLRGRVSDAEAAIRQGEASSTAALVERLLAVTVDFGSPPIDT